MSTSFAGMTLKNPVMAAAGTFGYGVEFEEWLLSTNSAVSSSRGLSREPMPGNPPPRLCETSAGMLNAIGLQNIGARAFLEEKLPILQQDEEHRRHGQRLRLLRKDYRRDDSNSERRAKASPPTS